VAGHCAIVHSRLSAVTSDRRPAGAQKMRARTISARKMQVRKMSSAEDASADCPQAEDQFIVGSDGKIATAAINPP
jgi:hypothetical protein